MPCDSRHLEPNSLEVEGEKLQRFVLDICDIKGLEPPAWAHKKIYGSYADDIRKYTDSATAFLCVQCRTLPDAVLYNPRDRRMRELSAWFEDHKKIDACREEKERLEKLASFL